MLTDEEFQRWWSDPVTKRFIARMNKESELMKEYIVSSEWLLDSEIVANAAYQAGRLSFLDMINNLSDSYHDYLMTDEEYNEYYESAHKRILEGRV